MTWNTETFSAFNMKLKTFHFDKAAVGAGSGHSEPSLSYAAVASGCSGTSHDAQSFFLCHCYTLTFVHFFPSFLFYPVCDGDFSVLLFSGFSFPCLPLLEPGSHGGRFLLKVSSSSPPSKAPGVLSVVNCCRELGLCEPTQTVESNRCWCKL